VVVHVVGAVKHQWLDKQPEFQRMLPGSAAE
jgi:cytochrome b561